MKTPCKLANDIWSDFPRWCIALALNGPNLVLGLIVSKDVHATVPLARCCLVDDYRPIAESADATSFSKSNQAGRDPVGVFVKVR